MNSLLHPLACAHRPLVRALAVVTLACLGACAGVAQPVGPHDDDSSPVSSYPAPEAGALAARLAVLQGNAWSWDAVRQTWAPLAPNQPLSAGDRLRTDASARLGVRVGSSSLWLDSGSELEIKHLHERAVLLIVHAGSLAVRLRTAQVAQAWRIQTEAGVVSPESEGLLRIDHLGTRTRVAAYDGRARFDSHPDRPLQRAWLREGEQIEVFFAEGSRLETQARIHDVFARWLLQQDRAEGGATIAADGELSPEVTGAEVLAQHGHWEWSAEYGRVWIPRHPGDGWAPYQQGRWLWKPALGWVWWDQAPWGFTTYVYGSWVQWRDRWVWAPGQRHPRAHVVPQRPRHLVPPPPVRHNDRPLLAPRPQQPRHEPQRVQPERESWQRERPRPEWTPPAAHPVPRAPQWATPDERRPPAAVVESPRPPDRPQLPPASTPAPRPPPATLAPPPRLTPPTPPRTVEPHVSPPPRPEREEREEQRPERRRDDKREERREESQQPRSEGKPRDHRTTIQER